IPSTLSRRLTPEEAEAHKERVLQSVKELRERIYSQGVYCLSRCPLNNLMWGHYGNSHRGYCIEYRLPEKSELLDHPNVPRGVDYKEERPSLDWAYANLYPFNMLLYYMIGVKHIGWSYEQESRIVYPAGGMEYDLPFEVSSIIFGAKADEQLIQD